MSHPNTSAFFLGANSRYGFYSLYHEFCSSPNDRLHIIKGGPGTGKSTFMRRIGAAAEERGYPVEYILCSGDPNSLDGVYIPELHIGWADGTAPHSLDPEFFGITGDYENLGRFCRTEALWAHESEIRHLTVSYRKAYHDAYACLHAAGTLEDTFAAKLPDSSEEKLRKRAHSKIEKELSQVPFSHTHAPSRRFIRALCCDGNHFLTDTLQSNCTRLCVLSSNHQLEQIFFEEIISELTKRQILSVICQNPMHPNQTEAILLPHQKLAFISEEIVPQFFGSIKTIHLDSYLPTTHRMKQKQERKILNQLLEKSFTHLKNAKSIHDELETYYRPTLDIDALDQYTHIVIDRLFST